MMAFSKQNLIHDYPSCNELRDRFLNVSLCQNSLHRNAVESEMFAACNLRRAIDLQRLCCFMGYVSVM